MFLNVNCLNVRMYMYEPMLRIGQRSTKGKISDQVAKAGREMRMKIEEPSLGR